MAAGPSCFGTVDIGRRKARPALRRNFERAISNSSSRVRSCRAAGFSCACDKRKEAGTTGFSSSIATAPNVTATTTHCLPRTARLRPAARWRRSPLEREKDPRPSCASLANPQRPMRCGTRPALRARCRSGPQRLRAGQNPSRSIAHPECPVLSRLNSARSPSARLPAPTGCMKSNSTVTAFKCASKAARSRFARGRDSTGPRNWQQSQNQPRSFLIASSTARWLLWTKTAPRISQHSRPRCRKAKANA